MHLQKNREVIHALVRRHAEDAAFYWSLHDNSERSPTLSLASLSRYNQLLDAHLEGLQVAGQGAWQPAYDALQRWRKPGEAFVCTYIALHSDDTGFLDLLAAQLTARPDELLRGVISALAWVPDEFARAAILTWSQSDNAVLQVAALRAIALINSRTICKDAATFAPVAWLRNPLRHYLRSSDPYIRAAACRVAGTCAADEQLKGEMKQLFEDADRPTRAQAAIAMSRLLATSHNEVRRDAHGIEQLRIIAAETLWQCIVQQLTEGASASGWHGKQAERRLDRWTEHLALMIPLGIERIAALLEFMPPRTALRFLLNHGDLELMSYVEKFLSESENSRYAGWVWQTLSGVDLVQNGLVVEEPAAPDIYASKRNQDDASVGLPQPDIEAMMRRRQVLQSTEHRTLNGQALTSMGALAILKDQPQAVRSVAARHLQSLDRDLIVCVRSPVHQQTSTMLQLEELLEEEKVGAL